MNHARMCHEAWWLLVSKNPNRDKILTIYNRYLSIFETIRPALYTAFIVKLSSVFDNDKNSINLKTLIKMIENSRAQKFETTSLDFNNLWKRGRTLFKYRSKVIAHRDKKVGVKKFARETGFTYDDLKGILEDASTLLDEALLFMGKSKFHKFSNTSDFEKLINDLLIVQQ